MYARAKCKSQDWIKNIGHLSCFESFGFLIDDKYWNCIEWECFCLLYKALNFLHRYAIWERQWRSTCTSRNLLLSVSVIIGETHNHWRSQIGNPKALDASSLKKYFSSYLIAEFSVIKQRENNFTKLVVSSASEPI